MKDIVQKLKKYEAELAAVEREFQEMPEGWLLKKGKYFYHVINGRRGGITKNTPLIKKLCRKKYLQARKAQLTHNLFRLGNKDKPLNLATPEELIASFSKTYQSLPISYFYHSDAEKYLQRQCNTNNYKTENLTYETNGGTLVRTKSELMIANLLEELEIPYRYEIPIKMGGKVRYLDFTIVHPFTGEIIIWEHFGALHLEGYEKGMNKKMKEYLTHGLRPFETLIYTFEFDTATPGRIKELIEQVILK